MVASRLQSVGIVVFLHSRASPHLSSNPATGYGGFPHLAGTPTLSDTLHMADAGMALKTHLSGRTEKVSLRAATKMDSPT